MKECPKCGERHQKPGTYCSRSCANSRTWSEEEKKKRSISNIKARKNLSKEKLLRIMAGVQKSAKNKKINAIKRLLTTETINLRHDDYRLKIIIEQNGKCLQCGISKWNGDMISFELDHIDGNNTNNKRENLRALCPNCHSFTTTWRGRNNSKTSVRNRKIKEMFKIIKDNSQIFEKYFS